MYSTSFKCLSNLNVLWTHKAVICLIKRIISSMISAFECSVCRSDASESYLVCGSLKNGTWQGPAEMLPLNWMGFFEW